MFRKWRLAFTKDTCIILHISFHNHVRGNIQQCRNILIQKNIIYKLQNINIANGQNSQLKFKHSHCSNTSQQINKSTNPNICRNYYQTNTALVCNLKSAIKILPSQEKELIINMAVKIYHKSRYITKSLSTRSYYRKRNKR